jgi:hypothetical protein
VILLWAINRWLNCPEEYDVEEQSVRVFKLRHKGEIAAVLAGMVGQ